MFFNKTRSFLYFQNIFCKSYLQNISLYILFFKTGFETFVQVFYHEILFVKLKKQKGEKLWKVSEIIKV